ncbi:MAG: DUF3192 domain-containing protein [Candidatus Omnitrophota bacterium]
MAKKKIKVLIVIFCLFILSGSAFPATETNTKKPVLLALRLSISSVTDLNKRNLTSIYTGMAKEEVLKVMGSRSVIAHQLGERIEVKNPYRTETLVGKEDIKERKFEILFYATEMYGKDYRITDAKLTPLVFEDNKLIGIGWEFYKDTIEKYGITK